MGARVLVVGGGIAGLAAAADLVDAGFEIELWEADERLGGKIATSAFAGLANVDEAADAYLTRVPHAVELARRVGLTDAELTAPTGAHASVWHDGLHDVPDGVLLGVPASVRPFVTTRLLSWRGKLRAAAEPLLPRTDPHDSLGALIRGRFGDEVHERLVDALIGSIYAVDTDRLSLATVPQVAALAEANRSLLVAARAARAAAGTATTAAAPIFGAPRAGMAALVDATAHHVGRHLIHTHRPATSLEADGAGWRVDGDQFDAVVVATPARAAARLLAEVSPDASVGLAHWESADVAIVRLAVPGGDWPERLAGRSGYLVPKPDQGYVTAASFASQKWAHWQPADGSQVLRVSLGRDGLAIDHLDDEALTTAAIEEVSRHLAVDLRPVATSVTRWPAAFPLYRPGHPGRVAAVEAALPSAIAIAGAGYRGIGIPACIADGQRAAARVRTALPQSPAADG